MKIVYMYKASLKVDITAYKYGYKYVHTLSQKSCILALYVLL